MSQFTFYALSEDLHQMLSLPPVPFPVRKGREVEIFGGSRVAVESILEELDLFVRENPDLKDGYQETIGILAYMVGIDNFTNERMAEALRCFETGLAYRPGNLSLRINYAVALHSEGRHAEALRHYEYVIRDPDSQIAPLVWLMAARLHASTGNPVRALELARQCRDIGYDDAAVSRFIDELERGGAGAPTTETRQCPSCRNVVASGRRFCSSCGTAITA